MTQTSDPPSVRWKLELVGQRDELRALGKMFNLQRADAGIRIWFEEGDCYLHAPEFEQMEEAVHVHQRGRVLARRLSGLGLLKFGMFRPVQAGQVLHPAPWEQSDTFRFITVRRTPEHPPWSDLLAYLALTDTANAQGQPLPPTEQWAGVSDHDGADVDDALHLLTLAVETEDWRLLYVVYEIVEDHVGKASLMGFGPSTAEIRRFKHTANSRRALGTKARHGHRTHAPPPKPMTFKEARALVEKLLLAWLPSVR